MCAAALRLLRILDAKMWFTISLKKFTHTVPLMVLTEASYVHIG